MQSPPFRILEISNSHPSQPANTVCKQDNQGQQPQQLQAITNMNPTNRAGQRRREGEEEEEEKQSSTSTKKAGATFTGDGAHLLVTPMRLFQPEPRLMI